MTYSRKTIDKTLHVRLATAYIGIYTLVMGSILGVLGVSQRAAIEAQMLEKDQQIEKLQSDFNTLYTWYVNERTQTEGVLDAIKTASTDNTSEEAIEYEIRRTFGDNGDLMVRVARCESSLRPEVENSQPNSSATGIFQILANTHNVDKRWLKNYKVNIAIAKQMFDQQGVRPWEASRHCWSAYAQ